MSKFQIVLSGVGGQGLVSCGKILGDAATSFAGKNAAMTSSYGSEARGTFTKSDLIISDKPVDFPQVEEADVVLSLAQVAYDRYVKTMREGSFLVYDSDEVTPSDDCAARQYCFQFTKIARALGYAGAANLVAAGVIVKLTEVLEMSAIEQAIQNKYAAKPKVAEMNLQAFRSGVDLIK